MEKVFWIGQSTYSGVQPWMVIGRTDAKAEAPIFWPPDVKSWFIGKRPWCRERLEGGGEGDNRRWDGWMASSIQWTWVWANSGIWWRTGKPGILRSMGSQRETTERLKPPPPTPFLVIQNLLGEFLRKMPLSWESGALGSRPDSVTELLFHLWQVTSPGPQSPQFAKSRYWTRWTLNFLLVLFLSDSKTLGAQWGAQSAQVAIIPLPTAAKMAAPPEHLEASRHSQLLFLGCEPS